MLQGYGADVTAAHLAEASYAVEDGATWVATNTDGTLPTHRGIAPGNGALVGGRGGRDRGCSRARPPESRNRRSTTSR